MLNHFGRATKTVSPFILNKVKDAAAAYGLRKLINTADKAIRIRRSSDNTEVDIGFVGKDLDTAALGAFVGVNSAYVTTWYDQSGNGRHATQTTAANQPRIVSGGTIDMKNGKPTAYFDGGDVLSYTGATGVDVTAFSFLSVAGELSEVDNAGIISAHNGSGNDWDNVNAFAVETSIGSYHLNFLSGASSGIGDAQISGTGNTPFASYSGVKDGSSSIYATKNGTITYGTPRSATYGAANGGYVIGGRYSSGAISGSLLNGHISEIIVYPVALGSATRQAIEREQMKYYNIT